MGPYDGIEDTSEQYTATDEKIEEAVQEATAHLEKQIDELQDRCEKLTAEAAILEEEKTTLQDKLADKITLLGEIAGGLNDLSRGLGKLKGLT